MELVPGNLGSGISIRRSGRFVLQVLCGDPGAQVGITGLGVRDGGGGKWLVITTIWSFSLASIGVGSTASGCITATGMC